MQLELSRYLARIGLNRDDTTEKCLSTVEKIQGCHIDNIPYENLDAVMRLGTALDINAIYTKLVLENRGGWCYQHNGLLCWALRELGFEVMMVAATAWQRGVTLREEFSHMALIIQVPEGRYLLDVGWGGNTGPCKPIKLEDGSLRTTVCGLFKLEVSEDNDWVLSHTHLDKTEWTKLYRFKEVGQRLVDFAERHDKYMRGESKVDLIGSTPIVTYRVNGCLESHLLIENFYRHYKFLGAQKDRVTIEERTNLDDDLYETILKEKFAISNVDTSRLKLARFAKGENQDEW